MQTVIHPSTGQQAVRTGPALRRACFVRYGVPALFFSCFFIFLLCYIDPAVMYSSNGLDIHHYVMAGHLQEASRPHAAHFASPLFSRQFILELTPASLQESVSAPGGLTDLVVTLCIYACHYPVAGALAVTCVALFFYWIFSLYIQGTAGIRPFITRLLPLFFLLTICAWYELGYCAFLLPIAGALGFAVLYQRLRPSGAMTHAAWLSLFFWSAWYLLQWGCLLVLLFVFIHELFINKRRTASILITAAINGVGLYLLEARIIPLDMTIRWRDFMVLSGLPLAVIGFFPLTAIVLAVVSRLQRTPDGKSTAISAIIRISLLLCGTVAAAVWLFREPVNRDTRTIARTVYHGMNGQWDAVLHEKTADLFRDAPQKAGILQEFMVQAVDHALCRTGQLGDKLFAFPQPGFHDDQLLMLESTRVNGFATWVMILDLAMDLGMVNTAEKMAGEIMENMGQFPDIIYRRALIQIAKGNKDAAFVYLNKLAGMPFYRTEAKRLLDIFDDEGALLSQPRIAAMRANMDTVDYFLVSVNYEAIFKHLLQSNLGNKAAYDYLMTFYLLNKLVDGVAALAPGAPTFGYSVLPRYWQEALCVYQAITSKQESSGVSFPGLQQQAVERFNEFSQAGFQLKNDPAAAAKLEPEFGDSYYYYYSFGHTRGVPNE